MNHRDDLHLIARQAIHNAIVLKQQFPEIGAAVLRHDTSHLREDRQCLRRYHNALGEKPRIVLGIATDVVADVRQILNRPGRPD